MEIVLENGTLRLALAPETGGTVLAFDAHLGGVLAPLLRRAAVPLGRSSNGSSFTLAPYSNRIRDGIFRFRGQRYALAHPEKHAIHGDVRDRPWQVKRATRDEAVLGFDSRAFADFNFPFPIVCEARFALQGDTLCMGLRLENAGSAPMPAGFGFHPYFERALVPEEEVSVEFRAKGVYPGETPLPTGPPVPLPAHMDFSVRRSLDVALDHCFAGWDGRATVHWPRSAVSVAVEASAVFRHVILYSPPGQPFFALEPVTHANDGFNLLAEGQADTGVVVLEAGEALGGEVRFRLMA